MHCMLLLEPAHIEDTGTTGNSECPKQATDAATGDVRGVTSPEAAVARPLPTSSRVGLGPVTAVALSCARLLPLSAAKPSPVPGNDDSAIEASAALSPGRAASRAGTGTLEYRSTAAGLARAPAGSRCVLPAEHVAFEIN